MIQEQEYKTALKIVIEYERVELIKKTNMDIKNEMDTLHILCRMSNAAGSM